MGAASTVRGIGEAGSGVSPITLARGFHKELAIDSSLNIIDAVTFEQVSASC